MFTRVPWARAFDEALNVGALINNQRGFFTLPTLNLATTFRVVVPTFTSGSVIVALRVGFNTTDAAGSPNGCDFVALAALGSSMRSVVFDTAAALPGVVGSPPGILPPMVCVRITTGAATVLRYQVYVSCISID